MAESADIHKERLTLVGVATFAGLLLGLITPVLLFGQRLAVQEERMRVVIESLAEVRKDVQNGNKTVTEIREQLAGSLTIQRGNRQ